MDISGLDVIVNVFWIVQQKLCKRLVECSKWTVRQVTIEVLRERPKRLLDILSHHPFHLGRVEPLALGDRNQTQQGLISIAAKTYARPTK